MLVTAGVPRTSRGLGGGAELPLGKQDARLHAECEDLPGKGLASEPEELERAWYLIMMCKEARKLQGQLEGLVGTLTWERGPGRQSTCFSGMGGRSRRGGGALQGGLLGTG